MQSLRWIRQEVFGLTLAQMAEIAAVSQATLSKWENGIHPADFDAIARIREAAAARQIPWDDAWLFDGKPSWPADAA